MDRLPLFVALFVSLAGFTSAQETSLSPEQAQAVQMAEAYVRGHPERFNVTSPADPLVVERVEAFLLADKLHAQVVFAQQVLFGIPVLESQIWVSIWGGRVVEADGGRHAFLALPPGVRLTDDEAARQVLGLQIVYATPHGRRTAIIAEEDLRAISAELTLRSVGPSAQARWAWKISASIFDIYVDAVDGNILESIVRVRF